MLGDVYIPENLFGFSNFSNIGIIKKSFLAPFSSSDLILCNFEAPLTDHSHARDNKQYNLINSSSSLDIFDHRFVLCLANNHMMDFGVVGLMDTIKALKNRDLLFAGAGINIEEAAKPAFIQCNGIRIAIICAADPRFQPAGDNTPGTLPASSQILLPIVKSSKKNADFIIVSIHAGMEFTPVPTPFMINLADDCLKAGAQVVKFHHAHCLSGYTENKGVILWGLGNYTFPYAIPGGFSPWFKSAVWEIVIKNNDQYYVKNIIPIQLDKNGVPDIAHGYSSAKIKNTIEKYSIRINRKKWLWFWRFISVLHPAYIWIGINNYIIMAKHNGFKSVFRQITSSIFLYSKKN